MDEEDDYDDFGNELEDALEDGIDDGKETEPSLPAGPGLPSTPPVASPAEHIGSDKANDAVIQPSEQGKEAGQETGRAQQMQEMLQSFTEDQLDRFEAHRRSSLNRKSMKRLLQAVTGYNPNSAGANNAAILLCGVAKMYVGELIEEARVIAAGQGHSGALQPKHVHEAFQQMEAAGAVPVRAAKQRRKF